MATFRKRGSSWQVQIRRSGHPPISRTFKSKSNAYAWSRQVDAEIESSGLPVDRRVLRRKTLADLLNQYREMVTPLKRGALQEQYRLKQMLAHPISRTTLAKLTPALIAQYRDERLRTVQGITVRREFAVLHHVFETAGKEWDIPLASNPVADVKVKVKVEMRNRRLTDGEYARLLQGCKKARNRLLLPIVIMAVETGMRRGELINILWSDVELKYRVILISHTKNGYERTIPLSTKAVEIINRVPRTDERVFPITANALRLAWERLRRRAGIIDLHFHDLRHEAISRFFERGLSVPEVALISGHRDYRMLFRYTHLRAEDIVAKLE